MVEVFPCTNSLPQLWRGFLVSASWHGLTKLIYMIINIISYHIISYITYHIIYHISYIIYHISHIICHISFIVYHISFIISYIIYHIISFSIQMCWLFFLFFFCWRILLLRSYFKFSVLWWLATGVFESKEWTLTVALRRWGGQGQLLFCMHQLLASDTRYPVTQCDN